MPGERGRKRNPRLEFYGKGITMQKSGHLRYTSPKELRGRFVHRVVIERLLEVTPYSVKLLLPWPYEVHHADYNKTNNRPDNLILLDERFHSCLTAHGPRHRGKFYPRWKMAPDWVAQRDLDLEDEVPF